MSTTRPSALITTLRYGAMAGLAGGLAEVVWVSLYAGLAGADAAMVARGVTTAVGLNALLPNATVLTGVAVHMLLALGLGVALAFAWRKLSSTLAIAPYAFGAAALAMVWGFNFFVALPLISPDFITMLPYSVSLASKLLFGLAAAEVLRRASLERVAATSAA